MANRRVLGVPRSAAFSGTFAVVATFVGVVLGLAVYSVLPAASSPNAPVAEVAGATLDREAVADSVVRVETAGCGSVLQASATIVAGPAGDLVLTNAHVVRGSGTATLHLRDGTQLTAEVLGKVSGRDAAVLRVAPGTDELPDALRPGPPVAIGDEVTVAGYPAGTRADVRATVRSSEVRSGYGGSTEVLIVGAPAEGGLSGGGVIDDGGRVVGLVAARDPETGSAVVYPIDSLLDRALGPIPSC